jgi:hypothetical protein
VFPTQVLDMQMDLDARLHDVVFATIVRQNFYQDQTAHTTLTSEQARGFMRAADGMRQVLHAQMKVAHAFRVTEDMSLVVQGVAAALDESDVFHRDLAPTGVGFVRFDRPLPVGDMRNKMMKAHYCTWGPVSINGTPSTLVTWWNDSHDPDDVSDANMDPTALAHLGRWRWIGADGIGNGRGVGPEALPMPEGYAERIEAEGDVPGEASNTARYLHALWTLLGQSITTVTDDDLDRPARRRAVKAGIPPRVSVIQLRRSEATARGDGESQIEWKRRWVQRAHMRWQPYGPRTPDHMHTYSLPAPSGPGGHMEQTCTVDGCEAVLRRIAIPAAIKGPDGLPLVVPDKVYSLER